MGTIDRPQTPRDCAHRFAEARQGSREALGELLQPLRRYLLSVAETEIGRELRVKIDASDAVQQTFLQAQRAIDDFTGDSEEEWRGWLRQILLNEIAQADRHFHTAKCHIGREVDLALEGSSRRDQDVPGHEETPSNWAIANENLARFDRALARLPDDFRRVIELRNAWASFDEIGLVMGRSAGAAQKLWTRAVERLREAVGCDG